MPIIRDSSTDPLGRGQPETTMLISTNVENASPAYLVIPGFFKESELLRSRYDDFFARRDEITAQSKQIWDYWYVPDQYTCFKTEPANIFGKALAKSFTDRLSSWSLETLGLAQVSDSLLSLYANGCGQGLHNDAGNGQVAYVYSITRWDQRRFTGGETVILKSDEYWQTQRSERARAGTDFIELIPASFDQLLIFDDRVIHGVRTVQGTMSPLDGRVVLHGHLIQKLHVAGDLFLSEVRGVLRTLAQDTTPALSDRMRTLEGFATARLTVAPDGSVSAVNVLLNRLTDSTDHQRAQETLRWIMDYFKKLRFPPKPLLSQITVPIRTR